LRSVRAAQITSSTPHQFVTCSQSTPPLEISAGEAAEEQPAASELPPFDIGSDLKESNLTDHERFVYKSVRTVRIPTLNSRIQDLLKLSSVRFALLCCSGT
jgi:hypothetical protein